MATPIKDHMASLRASHPQSDVAISQFLAPRGQIYFDNQFRLQSTPEEWSRYARSIEQMVTGE